MSDKNVFDKLFDRVYVVSLKSSGDRRSYIKAHLKDIGIETFEFHDGCHAQDPEVREFQESGIVASFPPCFRCGKASCGKSDCNNVLIPAQIATFITYLKLWKKIAARRQRALVLEDDVVFHPYVFDVLGSLAEEIADGKVDFRYTTSRLIRLGWALSHEHDASLPFEIAPTIRMSNPCHAITSTYAQAMLDRFSQINTTVDVFLHRNSPEDGEALTVLPPIASELSWSKGRFESLIHPKEVRANYLSEVGRSEEAEEYRRLIAKHFEEIAHR